MLRSRVRSPDMIGRGHVLLEPWKAYLRARTENRGEIAEAGQSGIFFHEHLQRLDVGARQTDDAVAKRFQICEKRIRIAHAPSFRESVIMALALDDRQAAESRGTHQFCKCRSLSDENCHRSVFCTENDYRLHKNSTRPLTSHLAELSIFSLHV